MFRRLEAAGLIRIAEVPQDHWDNFAAQTFMQNSRPFQILATQKLNELALNPRWKPSANSPPLSQEIIARTLESSWDFYAQREIFLGANCFGRDTTGAQSDGVCAHELMSNYPKYLALATKGLINLEEIPLASLPPSTNPNLPRVDLERAARVSLTPEGRRLATVDEKNSTATFVFGRYHVDQITKNSPISSSHGVYRAVDGSYIFDLRPEFKDVWQQAGQPTYRERRFRAVFYYNEKWPLSEDETPSAQQREFLTRCTKCAPKWTVATASNGRYTAEDDGPRNGEFESANVPPTIDALPTKGNTSDDSYNWHLRLGHLQVREVLRDEDYKGPLATPGETFRLVLAKIGVSSARDSSDIPTDLSSLLPARLRCIVKYDDFNKEWKVVAIDVASAESERWATDSVR
jgi:hypothetical protein